MCRRFGTLCQFHLHLHRTWNRQDVLKRRDTKLRRRVIIAKESGFGGLGVSVLAFGTQVRGFKVVLVQLDLS
jgi:hypothetical protein